MAKHQNTFAKRQREVEKKRKADEKRARRKTRRTQPEPSTEGFSQPADELADDDADGTT